MAPKSTSLPLRRSKRLETTNPPPAPIKRITKPAAPQRKTTPPSSSSTIASRSRSLRVTSLSTRATSIDLDALDAQLAQRNGGSARKPRKDAERVDGPSSPSTPTSASSYSSSSSASSCSYSAFATNDEDSLTDYEDYTDFTEHTNALFGSASRNASYDSRYEPGNEDYEMDGFVAPDGEEEIVWGDWSEAEGDATSCSSSVQECDGENEKIHDSDDEVRRIELESALGTPTRRSSTASKLFYSDPDDAAVAVVVALAVAPWENSQDAQDDGAARGTLVEEASEELVEEIGDAVTLFGRRCNRGRKPVCFWMTAEVLADGEVSEVLERAKRVGLGRCVDMGDGTVRWTVGPRGV